MSCIKSCCSACYDTCCSFLGNKEKKEYPHVQYSSLQDRDSLDRYDCSSSEPLPSVFSPPHSASVETWKVAQGVVTPAFEQCPLPPDRIFTFPQSRIDYTPHPQFSKSDEDVIIDKPTGRKFSTQTSVSSVSEYSAVVRTARSSSLPRTESPATTTPVLPRRASIASSVELAQLEWMPSLPILQEQSLESDQTHPSLQFSLHYDIQRSLLSVHLHHASNLPAMDKRGTSDPFVVMFLIPNREEIFESSIVPKTLDPVFDQSFQFEKLTPDDIRRQTLIFRIYDHDKFSKNDIIGAVGLPLKTVDLFGVVMRMRVENELEIFKDVSLFTSYHFA